jgi:hypothetical protein
MQEPGLFRADVTRLPSRDAMAQEVFKRYILTNPPSIEDQ